ncbi:hypothetical protein RN2511_047860 [Rhodococcus sp. NKCM2511]|uniref:hypothetical protein n=1 Tax=Rhodococcus sp. NKCM2511 TaxID=2766011 RepID=UPI0019108CFB|nr:hypothetical protein [Rhodococcus sp. NKCM2511]GHP20050.1 hypothetical protein RN2511_047860 [Rhodococcus sp. NKCM2511]
MFDQGDHVLYMKVGIHAKETLADIIERKRREIDDAGMAMWGYGGNTCHPATMVQPFAHAALSAGKPVVLAMQPINSKHFADPIRAEMYSRDGTIWDKIPPSINVLGSRYALCLSSLEMVDAELDLGETQVAVGNSSGRSGDRYIQGRVDKACLTIDPTSFEASKIVKIGFAAKLTEPFAVFLKS